MGNTVPIHYLGITSFDPALSIYRIWEWCEDSRWQMLFTVLAEVAPVEIVIDTAADFPGKML